MLEYWLPRYSAMIRRKVREYSEDSRVGEKWRWLADYHDHSLRLRNLNRRRFITGLAAQHSFSTLV